MDRPASPPSPPFQLRVLAEPPNLLSLVRIPMAGLVWVVAPEPWSFLALAAVAGLTDLLDGFAARWMARRGPDAGRAVRAGGVGDWLDPLCDKVFVASAVVAAAVFYQPSLLVLGLTLFRDIAQVVLLLGVGRLLWHRRLRIDYRATKWGKATTVVQFATLVSMLLLPQATLPLAALAAVVGAVTVSTYARRAWREISRSRRGGEASSRGST